MGINHMDINHRDFYHISTVLIVCFLLSQEFENIRHSYTLLVASQLCYSAGFIEGAPD